MVAFAAGQVVLRACPFSDLSRSKFRPALLLGRATSDNAGEEYVAPDQAAKGRDNSYILWN